MATTAPAPRKRIIQLDVLRLLAVLLVLGRHMEPIPDQTSAFGHLLKGVGDVWLRCGWVGVDLFFVLSGFLVSGLLFREYAAHGRINFKKFFIRRGLKIYPPFYAMIIFTLALQLYLDIAENYIHVKKLLLAFLSEALFVQNYGPRLWPHTWSLAIEEHFYLLLPLTLILLYRYGRKGDKPFPQLPKLFAVVAFACLALRLITSYAYAFQVQTNVFPTHLRLDSLAFGVLLSYYNEFDPARLRHIRAHPLLASAFGLLCVAPAFVLTLGQSFFLHTYGFTLLYVGFGVLLIVALNWKPHAPRVVKEFFLLLAYLGARSYSIYLWHFLVRIWGVGWIVAALGITSPSYTLRWLLYMAGSIVVGVVLSNLIELPILRLRDRFFPSRTTVVYDDARH